MIKKGESNEALAVTLASGQFWRLHEHHQNVYIVCLPGTRRYRRLAFVQTWLAVSNPRSVDDVWHENVDRMCMCIGQPWANGCPYVAPMILVVMSAKIKTKKEMSKMDINMCLCVYIYIYRGNIKTFSDFICFYQPPSRSLLSFRSGSREL